MGSKCFAGGTHDPLPLFPWFYFTIAIFKVTSYTTNELTAAAASRSISLPKYRVISFSLLISLDLVFNWLWIQENKKKIGSCFPSIVWINWNSSNRSMGNSFHLPGLSFPESNWGGRNGEIWIRWPQRLFFPSWSSRMTLVLGPHSTSAQFLPSNHLRNIKEAEIICFTIKPFCTLTSWYIFWKALVPQVLFKIDQDFFPLIISSITFTRSLV